MKFFQGFLALLAVASAVFYAAFSFIAEGLLHLGMLAAGGLIVALDVFALLVWFVNWRYYPEAK